MYLSGRMKQQCLQISKMSHFNFYAKMAKISVTDKSLHLSSDQDFHEFGWYEAEHDMFDGNKHRQSTAIVEIHPSWKFDVQQVLGTSLNTPKYPCKNWWLQMTSPSRASDKLSNSISPLEDRSVLLGNILTHLGLPAASQAQTLQSLLRRLWLTFMCDATVSWKKIVIEEVGLNDPAYLSFK